VFDRYGITYSELKRKVDDAIRSVDPDIWVRSVEKSILQFPDSKFVIENARRENEIAMIRRYGGILWKIWRPGAPKHDTPSEIAKDVVKADIEIWNTGDIGELAAKVEFLLKNGNGR
jgi:hypothetical protein